MFSEKYPLSVPHQGTTRTQMVWWQHCTTRLSTVVQLLTYARESDDDPEDATDDVLVQEEDDGRVDDGDGEADGQHDGEDHPRQHHEPVALKRQQHIHH